MVKVYCKPINTCAEDFQKSITFGRNPHDMKSLVIDNYRPELRIGAFEVQLCKRANKELKQELLHSKLETKMWPNIGAILNKIGKRCERTIV